MPEDGTVIEGSGPSRTHAAVDPGSGLGDPGRRRSGDRTPGVGPALLARLEDAVQATVYAVVADCPRETEQP